MATHYAFVATLYTWEYTEIMKINSISSAHYPFGHITGLLLFPLNLCLSSNTIIIDKINIQSILAAVEKYKVQIILN